MKDKPSIAVIGLKGLPAFGGAAAVGENIIEQLKDKYDFTVYSTASHTDRKTGNLNGYQQIVFSQFPIKKLNTIYYYIVSAFHSVLFGKYDLVHLHHRDAAFITLILKLRFKVIITTHGSFCVTEKWKHLSWFFQLNERKFVRFADIVTCVSMEEKRKYKSEVGLETIYIPNGIELYNPNINAKSNSFTIPYLFFGAGRIINSKGLDVLLKALKLMNYEGSLLVAGDLEQMPDYKAEIMKLKEGINVTFLGLIKDKKELLSIIYQAQYFIFPSSLEAMSMMLLETASTKCPAVVSDILQNTDLFDGTEVLLFKTDDPKDLADKISFALNNPEEMKVKAENAYRKLAEKQQWSDLAKEYAKVFDQLIVQ